MARIIAFFTWMFVGLMAAHAANSTVNNLSPAAALAGSELLYCVQSSADAKCTTQAVADANAINPLAGYNASGSIATTTGSCSSSSNPTTLTVGSATGWLVGQGIDIAGAGVAGADLITSVTVIAGTTFTINTGCSTTVSGATVNHDDTAALSAAITAAMAASRPLHLQAGNYNVTSSLTAINSSLAMYGDGRTQSTILNRSTTANILTVDYQDSLSPVTTTISGTFRDFGILQASGITPTAGAGFWIGSSTACGPCTQYTSALAIQNVTINGQWAGIRTRNGLIRDWILNVDINNSVGTCGSTSSTSGGAIVYDNPSPGGDNDWTNVQIANTTTGDGLCIYNADTQKFTNLKVNTGTGGTGGGVRFKGGTILRQTFVNPSIEGNGTAPSCAFDFNSGTITQVTITGYEIALIPTPFCSPANVSGSLAIVPGAATDNGGTAISPQWIIRPLPTSSSGLPSGSIWNNSGVLNYVP